MPRPVARVHLALTIWRGWPDPWRAVRGILESGWGNMPNLTPQQDAAIAAYDPWADIDWQTAWDVAGKLTAEDGPR